MIKKSKGLVPVPAIPEEESQERVIETSPTVIAQITRAETDIQIETAKKYPRSIKKFRQDAMSMATSDVETAASCFYKLKRGHGEDAKIIEGPSVRLAEIIANAWGNMRYGARIVNEGEREVTAQGVAHDLEKNVASTIEVARRITTKEGRRFGDDMVQVTKNAACSIALRNAIFKAVPFTYAKQIYEQCKKVAVGGAKTLKERCQQMLDAFAKISVSKAQVLAYLEKTSIEEIGLAEIELMIGVFTAIKDGDTTIDQAFPSKKGSVEMPKAKSKVQEDGDDAQLCTPEQQKVITDLAKKAGEDKTYEILTSFKVEKPSELTIGQAKICIEKLSKAAFGGKK